MLALGESLTFSRRTLFGVIVDELMIKDCGDVGNMELARR